LKKGRPLQHLEAATELASEFMTGATIATPEGRFTADTAGPADAPLVLLLHGYPQTRHTWRHQVPALSAAGFRAVAPDQRGYSPGVRPDPARGLAAYGIDRLVQDVLDLADAAGGAGRPFHLVGHDWGGHVGWVTAHRHPSRLRSLAVLSRPHPAAFRRAFKENADDQQHRSRHHKIFHDPTTGPRLLEDGAGRLRSRLAEQGVPEAAVAEYVSVLGDTGPFRFEVLPGLGHFVTDEADEAAETVTRLLLSHLAAQR
jgi:pimeloyl-ACP methyl ester carboxylesterase